MLQQNISRQSASHIREWFNRLYRRAFRPKLDVRTQEITQILREVPIFSEFSRGTLRSFAESLHIRDYKRDEYIYRERDPGLGMYIIQQGRVRLLSEDEEGNLHESQQLGDAEVFGHLAILGDFRRFETAQAVTETSVFGFFRPELKVMIKRDPRTASALLSTLAGLAVEQYVSLYGLIVEKEGKVVANRMMDMATKRVDPHDSTTSFVVRP